MLYKFCMAVRQPLIYYSTLTQHFNKDSLKLYKYLLRQCQRLPKGPKEHYTHMVKQSYKQHVNETDPERIKEIVKRSYEDCDWILKKYLKK